MIILGYDVGGTKVSAIIGNENGEIIDSIKRKTTKQYGKNGLSQQLIDMGEELLSRNKLNKPDMIGIIFAGIVDSKSGLIVSSPNILGLKNYNITEGLEKHFGVTVRLENDASASTIAEKIFGGAKKYNNFVYITLSTGIGGGIFINGKLYRGSHGMAGEIGHMVMVANGPICGCGRRGCFETLAGGNGIRARVLEDVHGLNDSTILSKLRPEFINAKAVFDAKKEGDMLAQLIVEETIYYLAVGIVNIINILDPEAIFIGGGISKEGEDLFTPLRMAVDEEMKSLKRDVKIYQALENGPDLASIAICLYKY